VHAISDHFGRDFRISQNRADDSGIAMRERPHGVEHMHGVARSRLYRRARLIVVRVGVADGGDDFGGNGIFDQRLRARNFRSDSDNFHQAIGRVEKLLQDLNRRAGDRLRGMHAAARLADERPL